MGDVRTEYDVQREKCLKKGKLFEDKSFPAVQGSIYHSKPVPTYVSWKRPKEICDNPRFIVDGTCRFDLDQGALGNCWFVAAAATVASKSKLLEKVVPQDQDFEKDYAGIFRFHFWRYGRWEEVVVDDRLPVMWGRQLLFSKNREEPNEFWCALMEKAYAKLYGSYEALQGGKIQDGLVDMTGGAGEVINLADKNKVPKKLFSLLIRLNDMNSLMGCAIPATNENQLENGLVCGHAYSITGLRRFQLGATKKKLLRLRNPWGRKEWIGPWSDGSPEWDDLQPEQKKNFNLNIEEDGEFWMAYEDWRKDFQELQICHLTPDSPVLDEVRKQWCMSAMDSHWIPGVTAGGCGNAPYQDLYWDNPQCHVTITDTNQEGKCALVISLMHKYRRTLQSQGLAQNIIIGYDIYKVRNNVEGPTNGKFRLSQLDLIQRMDASNDYREVCHTYMYEPGRYCIVCATLQPHQDAKFYLRVVTDTEAMVHAVDELETGVGGDLHEVFHAHAGEIGGADSKGLRNILKVMYKQEGWRFTVSQCRVLIEFVCGKGADSLSLEMLQVLMKKMEGFKTQFAEIDVDNNGDLSLRQLRKLLRNAGMGKLRRPVQEALADVYGGDGDHYSFEESATIIALLSMVKETYVGEFGGFTEGDIPIELEQLYVNAIREV